VSTKPRWPDSIEAAADLLTGHSRRTPILTVADGLGLSHPVALKLELLQHTGSFKPRGAFNNLLSREVPAAGVVAASGGNHGAAVAFAARKLGLPARIYVPEVAGPAKIALIRETGADLHITEGDYSGALAAARAHEAGTGAIQVHAYDAPETVAGQGTLMLEWEEQGLDADTVVIAVGGGGLIAGALAWLAGRRKVVAVEPEACPTLNRALVEGPQAEVAVGGIAVNSLGARRIGAICYGLARAQGVESVLVPDAAIAEAQRRLWRGLRILAEPGGATALAALTSGAYRPAPGERVAVLICGGNPSPDPLAV